MTLADTNVLLDLVTNDASGRTANPRMWVRFPARTSSNLNRLRFHPSALPNNSKEITIIVAQVDRRQ